MFNLFEINIILKKKNSKIDFIKIKNLEFIKKIFILYNIF